MPRNRVIYQNDALYVGPAPASGYSFISDIGELGNAGNYNLVFPLHRVQSYEANINANYEEIQVLGKNSILNRPQIQPPEVNLDFEYIQYGVLNELRMGFYANYTIEYGSRSGEAYYPDNFNVFLLSGFTATDMSQTEHNDLRWPLQYRDRRNLYLVTEREGYDVHEPETYRQLHPRAGSMTCAGFGNMYITNYSSRAAVGDFPRVNVSYVGENLKFYSSGSGLQNPSVDSKSGNLVQDRIFNIPNFQSGSYAVSALLPGDINLDITSLPCLTGVNAVDGTGYARDAYSQTNLFENLGIKYSDIKIQSYQLDIPLPRRDLRGLGYKFPLDRKPELPLTFNFSFSAIVGDSQTGDWVQFMRQSDDYNVTVKLNNPSRSPKSGIGIRYDIRRAKVESVSYQERVGGLYKGVEVSMRGDVEGGLFMSGMLNNYANTLETDFLLLESSTPGSPEYVLYEDDQSNGRIILRQTQAPAY